MGPDGTEDNRLMQLTALSYGARSARWKSLLGEDYYRLLTGREKLKCAAYDQIMKWTFSPPADDDDDEYGNDDEDMNEYQACSRHGKKRLFQTLKQDVDQFNDILGILHRYSKDSPTFIVLDGLCWRCRPIFQQKAGELRWHLWDRLPEFFGLDHIE